MGLVELKEKLPDFARDIKLNLESVLTEEGAPGLSRNQIHGVALASAYATNDSRVIDMIVSESAGVLSPEAVEAAKASATIMAMNNVYYRFIHLSDDKDFGKMPARLRMNVIAKPGIEKLDFELMSLAVSAINGCGLCVNAHVAQIRHAGLSNEGIQSAVRISAIINATKQALIIASNERRNYEN